MPTELGAWLRQQRLARNWTRPELARRLIEVAQAKGDRSMPGIESLCHNIYRWERGADGPSERYKLAYCQAFAISVHQFGHGQPDVPGLTAAASPLAMFPGSPA